MKISGHQQSWGMGMAPGRGRGHLCWWPLIYCFSAATSMASEIVKQWQESFKLKIYEAYGMTEISGGKDIKAGHSQIL